MKHYKKLFVGIDISLKTFTACAIDIDSNKYLNSYHSYPNNIPGITKLCNQLHTIAAQHNFTSILIGYESTGNYGFHLPFYLAENKKISEFELKIFQINPKIIKNFRKAFNDIPKTDKDDPYIIAERLKIGKLYSFMKFDPKYFSLKFVTRHRFHIIENLVSEKARFISMLLVKAPGFVQNKLFSNLTGATSLALMTQFASIDDIAQTSIYDLTQFIITNSKNKIKNPTELAQRIAYIARESYRPNRVLHDNLNCALLASYRHIIYLEKEIKQIDKVISNNIKSFQNEFNILTSIKGIGPVFAAGIISEIVDISLFNKECQLAKYAGLTWHIHQSGQFSTEETSLTKSGNKYLRYYLVQAAQSLSTKNEFFFPYYNKKYNEVNKHQHKRAIVLLARKLVRIIFALLSKNQLYKSPAKTKVNKALSA